MGYKYTLKHGFGPGTLPKNVNWITVEDHPENKWWQIVTLDRTLTDEEMRYYDIYYVGKEIGTAY